MLYKSLFIFLLLFLVSCNIKDSRKNKIKNIKIEEITRGEKDIYFDFSKVESRKIKNYPFENEVEHLPKISKEYFRCKGSPLNLERIDERDSDNIKIYLDCEGSSKHSLPLINKKENVYPVLVDILNYLQKKTKKRVNITCGHRCPKHNTYADFDKTAKTSKHMIGAEVDFYVEGYENKPFEILDLIFKYFKEKKYYKNKNEYENFYEYTKATDVKNPPFYNKEIFVKIYDFDEGRDFSNRHPYPYISLQVLFDKDNNEKVTYTWEKANKNLLSF